ncbi:hypothetical protein Q7C36_019426 [Tachysurus vachellii]|uniref:Uncharacterized protein n=1 Tax=Tachysurus vachellii TaxID=175792 RepID=A0AA88LWB3_TACVA|nr:hypothetical protein Q7C36_019426 [Tachysurus vachellii]
MKEGGDEGALQHQHTQATINLLEKKKLKTSPQGREGKYQIRKESVSSWKTAGGVDLQKRESVREKGRKGERKTEPVKKKDAERSWGDKLHW